MVLPFIIAAQMTSTSAQFNPKSSLRVGSAKVKITPAIGTPLGGNARLENYATGVAQDLFARALWLENGPTAVCVVSLDLLGLWWPDVERLRQAIVSRTAIPPFNLMIACTHTHSGPDTFQSLCWSEEKVSRDTELLRPFWDSLTERAVEVVGAAKNNAQPAVAKWGTAANHDIAHNRRLRMRSGETRMNWETPPPGEVERELGPIDPQISVLTFWNEGADVLGAIVHFACHPAIFAGANTMISGDFCGVAMGKLEGEISTGGSSPAFLFLNGASGNINHIDYRTGQRPAGLDEVNRCGESLFASVHDALASAEVIANPELAVTSAELTFPLREISEETFRRAHDLLAHFDGRDISLADGVPPEINARRILRFEEAKKTGKFPGRFTRLENGKIHMLLQTVRIGDITLSAVPSEIFVEFGLRLRREAGTARALLVGLANGLNGYIPTEAAFVEGGYEPTLGPNFLPPDTGTRIVDTLLQQVAGLQTR